MKSEPSPVFAVIRARSLLGMLVLAFAAGTGVVFVWPPLEAPIPDAVLGLAIYVLLAGFLWLACLRAGVFTRIHSVRDPVGGKCEFTSYSASP